MYGEALELPLESLLSYVWGDSRKVMESLSSGFGETLEWLWGEARYCTGESQNVSPHLSQTKIKTLINNR